MLTKGTRLLNAVKKIYKTITGKDSKSNDVTTVVEGIANNYTGEGGTTVVANPTLAGTEDTLTGIQVGDTKYAMPQFNFVEYVKKGVQFTLNNVTNDDIVVKYLQNVNGLATIITDTINANSTKIINGFIAFMDIPDDFDHGLDNFQPFDMITMTLSETGSQGLQVPLSNGGCDIVNLVKP